MDTLQVFTDIGGALGIPAMLLIFWLYIMVQELRKQVDARERHFKDIEDRISNLENTIAKVAADTSYIRGMVEMAHVHKELDE